MSRESEILEMCIQVLNCGLKYDYRGHSEECPFCQEPDEGIHEMDTLNHDPNCAYTLAKGLTMNLVDKDKYGTYFIKELNP